MGVGKVKGKGMREREALKEDVIRMVHFPIISCSDTSMSCYLAHLIQCSKLFDFAALHHLHFLLHLCSPHHSVWSKSLLPKIVRDANLVQSNDFCTSNALNTSPSFSSACLGIALDDSGPGREPHSDHLPPDQAMNALAAHRVIMKAIGCHCFALSACVLFYIYILDEGETSLLNPERIYVVIQR